MRTSSNDSVRRILCLAGSLRRDSWNRRLLHAAAALAPDGLKLEIFDGLGAVPMFDEDLERLEPAAPDGVSALRRAVNVAEGLIIATPEYNQSIPGVLKNALDWLSRECPDGEVLVQKPVAVLGASSGPSGTRLAQATVRQVLHTCGALVMPAPTLYMAQAPARFDGRELIDEMSAVSLQRFVAAFGEWVERIVPQPAAPATKLASVNI